jgi:2-oxo-4-hydroxy-4-carboxy-5-ureidoimidazoline decarboxylase
MNLETLNAMDQAQFTSALHGVFEHSPWIAQLAWPRSPFDSIAVLHAAMVDVVAAAPRERKLALLCAHPELAGEDARAGRLTASSRAEQAGAGLTGPVSQEAQRIAELNHAYRARFGFPFIIAVRDHDRAGILKEFERRLAQHPAAEFERSLEQVYRIARLRLDALFGSAPPSGSKQP